MNTLLNYDKFREDPHPKCPVNIFLGCGGFFTAVGINGKHSFATKYFFIKKLDPIRGCLYLQLLQPYKKGCELFLIPSNTCITVTIDCICGIVPLPDIPIKHHKPVPVCIEDCINGPFIMLPTYQETVLWETNLDAPLSGSIRICVEDGMYEGLQLKIYDQKGQGFTTCSISQKEQERRFKDCKKIMLTRMDGQEKVKGVFEIRVRGFIDDQFVSSFL